MTTARPLLVSIDTEKETDAEGISVVDDRRRRAWKRLWREEVSMHLEQFTKIMWPSKFDSDFL